MLGIGLCYLSFYCYSYHSTLSLSLSDLVVWYRFLSKIFGQIILFAFSFSFFFFHFLLLLFARWLREQKKLDIYVEPRVQVDLLTESSYFNFVQTWKDGEQWSLCKWKTLHNYYWLNMHLILLHLFFHVVIKLLFGLDVINSGILVSSFILSCIWDLNASHNVILIIVMVVHIGWYCISTFRVLEFIKVCLFCSFQSKDILYMLQLEGEC